MKTKILLFIISLNFFISFSQVDNSILVIGGQNANEGQFPWIADLYIQNYHACGGVLIAPQWVLTAAHCIDDSYPINKIRLNSVNTLGPLNPLGGEERNVLQTFIHPLWDPFADLGSGVDLALIKLSSPINNITPVTLPTTQESSTLYNSILNAYISGWGLTQQNSNGNLSDILQWANANIYEFNACNNVTPFTITQNYFCIGYTLGESPIGAAAGDSGSPSWIVDSNGNIKVIGIVHGGELVYTDLDKPGLFVRVGNFRDWIDSIINGQLSLESINELNNCYTLIKEGKLYIENLKNVESLEINIFDLTGKKIFHENINIIDNSTSVNIEDLKNGVYIINLSDKNGNHHSMKFLI